MREKGVTPLIVILVIAILVGLGGYFLIKTSSKTQESTSSQVSTTNQSANWKTYVNKELGYSIKLPPGSFKFEKDSFKIGSLVCEEFNSPAEYPIEPQKEYSFSICVWYNVRNLSLEDWDSVYYTGEVGNIKSEEVQKITLNQYSGIKLKDYPGHEKYIEYLIQKDTKVYRLRHNHSDDQASAFMEKVFSTIILLDQAKPSAEKMTYKSDKWGFSVQYPSSWSVEESINESNLPDTITFYTHEIISGFTHINEYIVEIKQQKNPEGKTPKQLLDVAENLIHIHEEKDLGRTNFVWGAGIENVYSVYLTNDKKTYLVISISPSPRQAKKDSFSPSNVVSYRDKLDEFMLKSFEEMLATFKFEDPQP